MTLSWNAQISPLPAPASRERFAFAPLRILMPLRGETSILEGERCTVRLHYPGEDLLRWGLHVASASKSRRGCEDRRSKAKAFRHLPEVSLARVSRRPCSAVR